MIERRRFKMRGEDEEHDSAAREISTPHRTPGRGFSRGLDSVCAPVDGPNGMI